MDVRSIEFLEPASANKRRGGMNYHRKWTMGMGIAAWKEGV
jgi:hypothetical protein